MDRLVVHGQVVHYIVIFIEVAVHLLKTTLDDVPDLVAVCRVVVLHGRVGACQDGGVAIHMLQTLAGKRGTTRSSADNKASCQLVGSSPESVAGALEAEHRVEDVNRDHRLTVCIEGGTGRNKCSGRASLVNTHVQNLTQRRLRVGEHKLVVNRNVVLSVRVVQLS